MRKAIYNIITVTAIVIIVYLISILNLRIVEHAAKMEVEKYLIYNVIVSFLLSILGLVAMKNWLEYWCFNKISINIKLLVPGIVLLILGAIPVYQWTMWLGIGYGNFFKMVLNSTYANHATSMLAGIIIGRSFR